MAQLIEWAKFAADTFDPAPTRRVGKRWVQSGEIPGRIIGGEVYVDAQAFEANVPMTKAMDNDKFGLM
jgi:hypothetical protein